MANKSELLLAAELLKIKAVKLQPEQPFTWVQVGSHLSIATTARHCRSLLSAHA